MCILATKRFSEPYNNCSTVEVVVFIAIQMLRQKRFGAFERD